ncbi:MAG: PIG-L deacetylase family protein [Planctomycetota bacterium]
MKVLIVGAHPDDCDIYAGGTAALWCARGDTVQFLSMTNGDAGHHELSREELSERRRGESRRAAAVLGIEYEVLEHHDGGLVPSLEIREDLIRRIRRLAPDLILTHRPCDYHPDHRYTSQLVQDSAFMVTVPLVCPDTPHLEVNPVLGYLWDDFQKPLPFQADVAVPVDSVASKKWDLLACHESQFFEWLPFNLKQGDAPESPEGRRLYLEETWAPHLLAMADAARPLLREQFGEAAEGIRFAECFEIGEHGRRPDDDEIRTLFPASS